MNITQIILSGLGMLALGFSIRSFRRARPADPVAFTNDYVRRVQRIVPGAQTNIAGPLEVEITLPGAEPLRAFLANAFNEYSLSRRDKNVILDRYIRALTESHASASTELDPACIVPVIRDQGFLDDSAKLPGREKGKSVELAHDRFNEELFILYVADSPHSVRYLSEEDLAAAKVDRASLQKLALENLRRLYPEVRVMGSKGAVMIRLDGTYESSLLLSESLWTNPKFEVSGEIIVAVPTRDLLLVTGTLERDGLEAVRKIAAEAAAKGSHRVSDKLFIRRDGKFEVWE